MEKLTIGLGAALALAVVAMAADNRPVPSVAAVTPCIKGLPAVKSTVSLTDVPAGASVQWELAGRQEGPYAPLQGVTGPRMVVPAIFSGKWVRAQVNSVKGAAAVATAPVQITDRSGNRLSNSWMPSATVSIPTPRSGLALTIAPM